MILWELVSELICIVIVCFEECIRIIGKGSDWLISLGFWLLFSSLLRYFSLQDCLVYLKLGVFSFVLLCWLQSVFSLQGEICMMFSMVFSGIVQRFLLDSIISVWFIDMVNGSCMLKWVFWFGLVWMFIELLSCLILELVMLRLMLCLEIWVIFLVVEKLDLSMNCSIL